MSQGLFLRQTLFRRAKPGMRNDSEEGVGEESEGEAEELERRLLEVPGVEEAAVSAEKVAADLMVDKSQPD